MAIAYLSLGTNLGVNLAENLNNCIQLIAITPSIKILAKSSQIQTKPVDMDSKNDFLNQVIKIETSLSSLKLLNILQKIEFDMGRTKKGDHSDRIIDIDIISFGDEIISSKILSIPHPKMHTRKFVLLPLQEIEPLWIHPITKKSIDEILEKINNIQ